MADRMSKAHAEVPRATVTDEADVDAWSESRSVTLRLIRAIVAGGRTVPALNAWFEREQLTRRLHAGVDLGVAVDTDDGLFVPVLRNIWDRTPDDLEQGLDKLKQDICARTLPPSELMGQTITLSNFGTIWGRFAELVVVPPQVAIVGVGRLYERVILKDGQPAAHGMLPLSVTFDHRAVTGAEAARFLRAVIEHLDKPR